MKIICCHCKEEKEDIEFDWRNKSKDRKQSYCKTCRSNYHKKYYEDNENRRKALREGEKKRREAIKVIVEDIKKNSSCLICGETKFYLLQFHHRDGAEKEFTISHYANFKSKKDKLYEEIKKCDILCANCHIELHYLEGH